MDNESATGGATVRFFLIAASAVVLVWGLKWASSLILPVLSAGFLAVLCIPPMRRLERWGAPTWLALSAVLVIANIGLLLVIALIGSSVVRFESQIDFYRTRLNDIVTDAINWLRSLGLDVSTDSVLEKLDTGAIMQFAADTAQGMVSAAGNGFLIGLTVIFILFEAAGLPAKLAAARRARGKENPEDLSDWSRAAASIHDYLSIKTMVSALTGVCATVLTWAIGVDFPLLWGLLAFLFNYVPNIGSIIAAVPAVLLALLQLGPAHAGGVAAGYFVINMVFGNAVEPKLLGDKLGLSTLVVWLSLIFWGWVWGPVGMLLSVPLTVMVRIFLEHSEDTRPFAIMLGPANVGDDQPYLHR